jgi:FHS family L-fucose permease-like MFS transporter
MGTESVEQDAAAAGRRRVFAVAGGLLAIWGIALWLYNALFFKFAHFFAFGPVDVAWALTAFHVAYVLLALPAVRFHHRFGYKLGILAALSVFAVGAFLLFLAIVQHSSASFFGAVLMIGWCGAWLDTALNPLVVAAGAPETAVRRLNVAHTFNGIGLFAAYLIAVSLVGRDYLLSGDATAATARPYVLIGLGAILLAFLIEQVALPAFASKGHGSAAGIRSEMRALLHDKTFRYAAAAIFASCVVLTVLWTVNYQYHKAELPDRVVPVFERGWFWFVAGRLAGAGLMRWIDPVRLLLWSAAACLIAIAGAAMAGGLTGWTALLAASLFLSITYPTVFGSALARNPARMALAAGLLVVAAGIGNAASSLITSMALDVLSLHPRIVVLLAFPLEAVILLYAMRTLRKPARAAA